MLPGHSYSPFLYLCCNCFDIIFYFHFYFEGKFIPFELDDMILLLLFFIPVMRAEQSNTDRIMDMWSKPGDFRAGECRIPEKLSSRQKSDAEKIFVEITSSHFHSCPHLLRDSLPHQTVY